MLTGNLNALIILLAYRPLLSESQPHTPLHLSIHAWSMEGDPAWLLGRCTG